MEVWTDGTIRPEDALRQAAQILTRHLQIIGGIEATGVEDWMTQEPAAYGARDEKSQLHEKLIEDLDLSVRVFNSLKRTGIITVGDVLDMLERGPDAMLAIRNFGEKSLDELVDKLKEKGYLREDAEIGGLTGD
jgi:DNA-directed RNA polymerase subunit alpha